MSGTSPHLASMTLRRASGAAMRTSAPRAICSPPPKTLPCSAAITGTGRSIQSVHTRCTTLPRCPSSRARTSSSDTGPVISDATSSPEQKLGPAPCRTTARTPGVAPTSAAASRMPSNIAPSRALCLSGRSRVTVATWSLADTSMRTRSDMGRTLALSRPEPADEDARQEGGQLVGVPAARLVEQLAEADLRRGDEHPAQQLGLAVGQPRAGGDHLRHPLLPVRAAALDAVLAVGLDVDDAERVRRLGDRAQQRRQAG